jgi:hypothetical protein
MIERKYTSGRSSFTAMLSRLSSRFGSVREMVQKCENPLCDHRRVLWPFGKAKAEGIFLQGRWYCSPDCFENAVQEVFNQITALPESNQRKSHRIPIGLLLLSRGMINDVQLKQALELQRTRGSGRIGKFLQEIQAVSEQDITSGLAAQWGCSVYPLDRAREFRQCASLLPLPLMENGHMLPVHYLRLQQTLYLAFVEGIDRTALYAVEQMLHMRTIPCVVTESAMLDALEELRALGDAPTTIFDGRIEPHEMARTTRSYACQVGAKDAWIARSGRFFWIRMQTAKDRKDILFQAVGDVQ